MPPPPTAPQSHHRPPHPNYNNNPRKRPRNDNPMMFRRYQPSHGGGGASSHRYGSHHHGRDSNVVKKYKMEIKSFDAKGNDSAAAASKKNPPPDFDIHATQKLLFVGSLLQKDLAYLMDKLEQILEKHGHFKAIFIFLYHHGGVELDLKVWKKQVERLYPYIREDITKPSSSSNRPRHLLEELQSNEPTFRTKTKLFLLRNVNNYQRREHSPQLSPDGSELIEDTLYDLGKAGLATINGLRIAYLSSGVGMIRTPGTSEIKFGYDASDAASLEASAFASDAWFDGGGKRKYTFDKKPNVVDTSKMIDEKDGNSTASSAATDSSTEKTDNSAEESSDAEKEDESPDAARKQIDILLTCEYPKYLTTHAGNIIPPWQVKRQSLHVLRLSRALKPRYHIVSFGSRELTHEAHTSPFYARAPFLCESGTQMISRFYSLGPFIPSHEVDATLPEKKALYACALKPVQYMTEEDLKELMTPDVTPSPFEKRNTLLKPEKPAEPSKDENGSKSSANTQSKDGHACWFCLSNPKVQKHLLSVVDETLYITIPRGGLVLEHTLIVPQQHASNYTELSTETRTNIERYKAAFRKIFVGGVLFFERFMGINSKGQPSHMHIHALPCVKKEEDCLQDLKKGAEGFSLEFKEFGSDVTVDQMLEKEFSPSTTEQQKEEEESKPSEDDSSKDSAKGKDANEAEQKKPATESADNEKAGYLWVELADGRKLYTALPAPSSEKKLLPSFARELMAMSVFGMPKEKANWRRCVRPREIEEQQTGEMRMKIERFLEKPPIKDSAAKPEQEKNEVNEKVQGETQEKK